MHDVPRQSLGEHLKVTPKNDEDGDERDHLDKRLAQHARYVYDLQQSSMASSSQSDSSSDSDDSEPISASVHRRSAAQRQRMSIRTNRYFDVPAEPEYAHYDCGALPRRSAKRRFFRADVRAGEGRRDGGIRVSDLHETMVNGGRSPEQGWDRHGEGSDMDLDGP
ncbi:hypothetical protein HDZ31DRAFT_70666 [Schizophyllum fasciatum]